MLSTILLSGLPLRAKAAAWPFAEANSPSAMELRLAALERKYEDLEARQAAHIARESGSTASVKHPQSSFVPVETTACAGLRPCLHTTAAERIKSGCDSSIWSGHWAMTPESNKTALARQPQLQSFAPHSDCDMATLWDLSPTKLIGNGHVTDATLQHATLRLQGLRGTLLLTIGSSIDHHTLLEVCAAFGRTKEVIFLPDKTSSMNWCHIKELNFSIAQISFHGVTSEATVRARAPLLARYATLQNALESHGWRGPPTFLQLGGVEWDFKQWDLHNGTAELEVMSLTPHLTFVVQVAYEAWPSLSGVFFRSMFASTYKGFDLSRFGVSVATRESLYRQYNVRMEESAAQLQQSDGVCRRRVGVSDMARVMHCPGACAASSGWTKDGLHPVQWVMRGFFNNLANVMADRGEACARAPGGRHAHNLH